MVDAQHVVAVCDPDAERRQQCRNALGSFAVHEASSLDELFKAVQRKHDNLAIDVAIVPASLANATVVERLKAAGCMTIRVAGSYRHSDILPNEANLGAAAYILHSELHLLPHIVPLIHDCEVFHRAYIREVWARWQAQSMPMLTKREQQILLLRSDGRSYANIADRLNVSVKTVSTHISNAHRKLGISQLSEPDRFAFLERHLAGRRKR